MALLLLLLLLFACVKVEMGRVQPLCCYCRSLPVHNNGYCNAMHAVADSIGWLVDRCITMKQLGG